MCSLKMINLLNKIQLDKKKIFFIVLGSFVILYLDFVFLIGLQFKHIKNISPKIIKLKQDMENFSKELATMQDLKGKQVETKQKALLKAKKVISEEQIALLLQSISDVANKNNVSISKILPSKAKEERASAGTLKLTSLLITLDLSCGYHNLGRFLNDLENAENFITVQEMKITYSSSDYLRQNVNLVLKTYVKK